MITKLVEDYKIDPVATIRKFKAFKKKATFYDIEQLNSLLSQALYVLRGNTIKKNQYSAVSCYFIFIVSRVIGCTEKELLSSCRKGDIPLGKQLLTKTLLDHKISSAEIMNICSYKNHSSVSSNYSKINTFIRLNNKKVISYISQIEKEAFLNTYLNSD